MVFHVIIKLTNIVRRSDCYPFSIIFRGEGGVCMEIAKLIVLEILKTIAKEVVTFVFKKLTSKNKKKKTSHQPTKPRKSSKRK